MCCYEKGWLVFDVLWMILTGAESRQSIFFVTSREDGTDSLFSVMSSTSCRSSISVLLFCGVNRATVIFYPTLQDVLSSPRLQMDTGTTCECPFLFIYRIVQYFI